MASGGEEKAKDKDQESETSNRICNTDVTIDIVQKLLLGEIQSAQKKDWITSWKAEEIGLHKGFLSHIIRLHIDWHKNEFGLLPNQVALKIPTIQSLTKVFDGLSLADTTIHDVHGDLHELVIPFAHINECSAYEMLSLAQVEEVPIPKIYHLQEVASGQPGLIIMEDLSDGAAVVSIGESFRLQQLLHIAGALASLHAYCIQNTVGAIVPMTKQVFRPIIKMMHKALDNLAEQKPDYFTPEKVAKVREFMTADYLFDVMQSYKKRNLPPVLVHGDLGNNNILFKKDETQLNGASDTILGLIDWQFAKIGSIAEDFGRLLTLGCSSALRKAETENVLRYYYSTLVKYFPEEEAPPPFDFDSILAAYREILPYSMTFAVAVIGMIPQMKLWEGEINQEQKEELFERVHDVIEDVLP